MITNAHSVVYSEIGQASRTEQVVERLSNAIVSGLLEPEAQLPSEAELARLFGVSTVTVREALNTLRARRLIETRRGRNGGSFIRRPPADEGFADHPLRGMATDHLADLGELHGAVIGRSAWLAAQRGAAQDHQRLARLAEDFAGASQPDERVQADMRYLLALAASAQSARLAKLELEIQGEWAPLATALYGGGDAHAETARAHLALCEALRRGRDDDGRTIAEAWIKAFTDRLIAKKHQMEKAG